MKLSGKRVAVTGATGFVGRSLVRTLASRGAHVVGVVRNPDKVPSLRAAGVELRQADLGSRAALTQALSGVDAVFSNAALIGIGDKSREALIETNVQGTQNVLQAAADAGATRVVMTSSAAAYREKPGAHYSETDPLLDRDDAVGRFGWYSQSKGVAEREAWKLAEALGLSLSTVRPHQIHGAFDDTGFTRWMRRFMRPPVSLFPARMRLPSVYVGDLTEAMCRCLERPHTIGRAYNVTGDPDGPTYWDLMRAYGEAGGKTPMLVVPVPVPIRRTYDLRRARAELDFENRPAIEGFREMLRLEREAETRT